MTDTRCWHNAFGEYEWMVRASDYDALLAARDTERTAAAVVVDNLRAERDALAARLAEAERDAQCYHHLVGLIRANPNTLAGEVLDWFLGVPPSTVSL